MSERSTSDRLGEWATRPDLGRRAIWLVLFATLLGCAGAASLALTASSLPHAPGQPLRQSAAIIGALLLLVPVAFSVAKRSGWAASPPAWFVAHVLCGAVGTVLITYHATTGNLLSPPGLVALALWFLVAQGSVARASLSHRIAALFAARISSFQQADPSQRERLGTIIGQKRALLSRLDEHADEALFSPTLWHGMRHPWRTLRYARLASAEARLVGRQRAGPVLAYWRRAHIAVAYLFVAGLIAHVVVVTFFAGYAAGGEPIDWWHITAWGG